MPSTATSFLPPPDKPSDASAPKLGAGCQYNPPLPSRLKSPTGQTLEAQPKSSQVGLEKIGDAEEQVGPCWNCSSCVFPPLILSVFDVSPRRGNCTTGKQSATSIYVLATVIIGRTNIDTVTEHADRNKVLDLLRLVVLTVQAPRTEEQSLQQS